MLLLLNYNLMLLDLGHQAILIPDENCQSAIETLQTKSFTAIVQDLANQVTSSCMGLAAASA